MRLSCNVHANFSYLMGYTGKCAEEDWYRFAMAGIDDDWWAHYVDTYSVSTNNDQNYRACLKKAHAGNKDKAPQLNKTNFVNASTLTTPTLDLG